MIGGWQIWNITARSEEFHSLSFSVTAQLYSTTTSYHHVETSATSFRIAETHKSSQSLSNPVRHPTLRQSIYLPHFISTTHLSAMDLKTTNNTYSAL